ncbi:MAG: cytochrome c [Nitrospirales bacterium]|nr:cytochrome c [Nitrospirales bacterium]
MRRFHAQKIEIKDLLIIMAALVLVAISAGVGDSHDVSVHIIPPSTNPNVKKLVNPYEVTEDFLAKGRDLFQRKAFCAGCHGPDGRGNGMKSNPYNVRGPFPRNFTDARWQRLRSDGEIFWVLKQGIRGTDMAPFVPFILSEEQAWQIVAYLRTFKKS